MNVYFDNAATTPIEKKVLDKMLPFMEDGYGNPSSIHKRGREIKSAIEKSGLWSRIFYAVNQEKYFLHLGVLKLIICF